MESNLKSDSALPFINYLTMRILFNNPDPPFPCVINMGLKVEEKIK